jgi:hypothetical protein
MSENVMKMDDLISLISISYYKERTVDDKPDLNNIRRIINDNKNNLNDLDREIIMKLNDLPNGKLLAQLNVLLEHHTRKISTETSLLTSLRKAKKR